MDDSSLRYLASLDEAERRLLSPLSLGAPTRKPWRVYLRWLEQRGDPRAELLELALTLADSDGDETKRARLRELLEGVDLAWWRLAQPAPQLLNCACDEARARSPRLRFIFECPRSWETMTPTGRAGVRRCDGCEAFVYDCADVHEATVHARLGRCVRVPPEVTKSVFSGKLMIGRPDLPALWAESLFEDEGQ